MVVEHGGRVSRVLGGPQLKHHVYSCGNPMTGGVEVTPDAVSQIELGTESFIGYSIVNAESMEAAVELAKTRPIITSVVVYELARM
jgi:hypothetical protein